ncbi:MAG: septum formation initiator family protein [Clostridia bacterium]|nr:septum formation initiator family protein [Clostridia bacterium]
MASRKKEKKPNILVVLSVVIFLLFVTVMLGQLFLQLKDKQQEIENVKSEISELEQKNRDLKYKLDNKEQYLEQKAREKGYVNPGADVYKEIS